MKNHFPGTNDLFDDALTGVRCHPELLPEGDLKKPFLTRYGVKLIGIRFWK